ncbi:MAG TPA: hypothetical protein VIM73_23505, partial [Polyangiaceae bacterium]
ASADRRVRVWDLATKRRLLDLPGHEGKVFTVHYSSDGSLLASGGEDKITRIYDSATGSLAAALPAAGAVVRVVRFVPGAPAVLVGSDDGTIRRYDLADLRVPGSSLAARSEQAFGLSLLGSRVIRR